MFTYIVSYFHNMIKRIVNYFIPGFKVAFEFKSLWLSYSLYDVIMIFILSSVFSVLDPVRGRAYYLLYYFVMLLNGFSLWKSVRIIRDIREGDLLIYLTKPMNYLVFRFFYLLGLDAHRHTSYIFIVFLISFIFLHLPFINFLLFIVFLLLSFLLEYVYILTITLFAFYFYESVHFAKMVNIVLFFLQGEVIPSHFFPAWFKGITDWLFVSFLGYGKVEVLTEGLSYFSYSTFLAYLINFGVLASLSYLLWKKGLKRFEAQGG